MGDPKGSYYASMGRDQLKRELFDRDIALAQSRQREAEWLKAAHESGFKAHRLQQERDRLREVLEKIKAASPWSNAGFLAKQALARDK